MYDSEINMRVEGYNAFITICYEVSERGEGVTFRNIGKRCHGILGGRTVRYILCGCRVIAARCRQRQMEQRKYHKSTIERVRMVRAITMQHYESGNQSRCYKAIWRQYIFPKFKICYRTYLNYLGIATGADSSMG